MGREISDFGFRISDFEFSTPHLGSILAFECSLVDLIDRMEISVVRYAFCRVDPEFGRGLEAGRRINGT